VQSAWHGFNQPSAVNKKAATLAKMQVAAVTGLKDHLHVVLN